MMSFMPWNSLMGLPKNKWRKKLCSLAFFFLCMPPHFMFFLFIEFIGVTLVNKMIQVSGAQFHSTSSVHCVVCSPPQVRSPSITIHPPKLSSTSPWPPSPWQSPRLSMNSFFFCSSTAPPPPTFFYL
ncbi:hypothetical protein HJG60_009715 [Phyllostomus discolor]|uniref:Uncharacterized protein n=1 Tax=Phyllostomus discolor TaxID=89673 RepID=A0A834B6L9_9CHIR|nr:hypothetical protein HJG60_009715 [Phyllostomus discolor]